MRTFSAPFTAAMLGSDTTEIPVFLVTISHPEAGGEDLFFSSDTRDLLDYEQQLRGTVSRGRNYAFLPMSITLPEEGDDAEPVLGLVLDGVTREATPILRATIRPADVTVELTTASAPDEIESEWPFLELTSADADAGRVTLSLSVDGLADEPFPADNFTPGTFGGLWATT